MTDQTPNSVNQLMAQVLESALLKALKPIVERLDRIEDSMIDQPPVTRDQLSYLMELQKNEILNQQLSNNQNLSDALIRLADRLEERETERNQQLTTLTTQVQALTEASQQQSQRLVSLDARLSDQQQTVDKLIDVLVHSSNATIGLSEATLSLKCQLQQQIEQCHQQQSQQSEELSQRMNEQEQELEQLTTATNRLATELEALMIVLRP